jgi:hypothetical protein
MVARARPLPLAMGRVAPRRDPAAQEHTTLQPQLERREILVAQGAEYHSSDATAAWRLPGCLAEGDLRVPDLVVDGAGAELSSYAQQAHYVIQVTTSKREYKQWLERPGAQVIYDGHSRYGRGPCFGSAGPGHHWGTGRMPQVEGIFPMAYRFLEVPLLDVVEHEYYCRGDDVPARPEAEHLHPGVPRAIGEQTKERLVDALMEAKDEAQRRVDAVSRANPGPVVVDEDLHALLGADRAKLETLLLSKKYRAYTVQTHLYAKTEDKVKHWMELPLPHLVIHADWEKTTGGAVGMDLGATDLKCAVFAHFGCRSYAHNQPIVRSYKGWKPSSERLGVFTRGLTSVELTPLWLHHLLTYAPGSKPNHRGRAYRDAIGYAVESVNKHLNDHQLGYSIALG